MAKDRRTRDQKRKQKLRERKRRAGQTESMAYMGNKYKTEQLIPTWMHTEIGIYETFVMTDRKLLDRTVVTALETLIRQIRRGNLPPLEDTSTVEYTVGEEADFVIANIRRSWARHFAEEWRPPRDKLVGVLRTILGSIEKVRSAGPRSQSYLRHIEGFLTKRLGVSVQSYTESGELIEEPEDELILLGRQWMADRSQQSADEFHSLAMRLLKRGEAERVVASCHQLIGEESDPNSPIGSQLIALSMQAQNSLVASMG